MKKFISFILFCILFVNKWLYPQDISIFNINANFYNWKVSRSLDLKDDNTVHTSSITFQYPMEVKLLPELNDPIRIHQERINQPVLFTPLTNFTSFQNSFQKSNEKFYAFISNSEYNLRQDFDKTQLINHQIYKYHFSQNPSIVFLYKKNNFLLNFDLQIGLSGTSIGTRVSEVLNSRIILSYKIGDNITNIGNAYINLGLQLNDVSKYDHRFLSSLRKIEQNDFSLMQGVSFSTKNITFEGILQLPINNASQFSFKNLDLLKDEVHGRLGLRWYLPETTRP